MPIVPVPSFTSATAEADAIDPTLSALLALFAGPLSAVSFPDVSGASLGELADRVRRAAGQVVDAQEKVGTAKAALDEQKQLLLAHAHRALAYARVYAQDKAELSGELERIALPRSSPRGARGVAGSSVAVREPGESGASEQAPRKRGRPRKNIEAPGSVAAPAEAAPGADDSVAAE